MRFDAANLVQHDGELLDRHGRLTDERGGARQKRLQQADTIGCSSRAARDNLLVDLTELERGRHVGRTHGQH